MRAEILVTGGGGLLGYALKQLCPEAFFPTRQECDLTDPSQVRRLFQEVRPKQVLHLAAKVGGVKSNKEKNADYFVRNVQINTNVLSAAQEQGVARLVSILSTCAFPMKSDSPNREDDLHSGMPFAGNLGYGYAKRMLDIHTRLLWEQHGCKYSTITPVTMYGPNDRWDPEEGHVLGALISKSVMAKQLGRSLSVWGTGKAIRQFVFAFDVARILLDELQYFENTNTLIIAPDEGITIGDLARLVAKVVGFEGPIVFDAGKPEGEKKKVVESQYFSSRHKNFSFTPLEIGLRSTVEWYLEYHAAQEGVAR